MAKKQVSEPLINRIPHHPQNDNVPEAEKMRLFESTGLLQKVKQREAELAKQHTTSTEYLWQAIFMSIPFAFLLGTFDITVKVQFSEPWTYSGLLIKSLKSIPALIPFIYLTNRYKSSNITQTIMATSSVVVGSFLLYTMHHSPSLGQMMRAPGLATIWVYFVVQLNLLPAVISLLISATYWYFGLRKP
ncbi:hypothetical protein J3Q64DRAFT_1807264 [Phycomyces blakesleeanus]|uniref:DUF7719 domain-containing protein n=2 Tax=Phycomyces blakesleeanus TaxID=4837 RepID=A0ABR3BDG6_PHYBL